MVARVPYTDPTITLFTHKHMSIIFVLAVVFISFLLPLVLLIMLYPTICFRKVSICLKPRWLLAIKIFTDTFQGSFKDGTNGTRDYRPAAGTVFILWIILPVLIAACSSVTISWRLFILPLLIVMIVLLVVLQPYKYKEQNTCGILLILLLTIGGSIFGILDAYNFSTSIALLGIAVLTIPHCVFYGYGIYWVVKKVKHYYTTVSGEGYIYNRLECGH